MCEFVGREANLLPNPFPVPSVIKRTISSPSLPRPPASQRILRNRANITGRYSASWSRTNCHYSTNCKWNNCYGRKNCVRFCKALQESWQPTYTPGKSKVIRYVQMTDNSDFLTISGHRANLLNNETKF